MSLEGQLLDHKSLRAVTGKTADWAELAKDCVAFANALGGCLLIGVEDGQTEPPPDQRLPAGLAAWLELRDAEQLRPWLGRLGDWGLVRQAGRTQATRYFVAPDLLRRLDFPAVTTLKRIEDHRLLALVQEDVARYPGSAFGEIHQRIGAEIPLRRLRTTLTKLVDQAVLHKTGERRGTRYTVARSLEVLTNIPVNPAGDRVNSASIPQRRSTK